MPGNTLLFLEESIDFMTCSVVMELKLFSGPLLQQFREHVLILSRPAHFYQNGVQTQEL